MAVRRAARWWWVWVLVKLPGLGPARLRQVTDRFIFLEEGDICCRSTCSFDRHGEPVERKTSISAAVEVGGLGFDHYMLKEIHEQPRPGRDLCPGQRAGSWMSDEGRAPPGVRPGTGSTDRGLRDQFHAGMVARYWLEELAGIACQVEVLRVPLSQAGHPRGHLAGDHSQSGRPPIPWRPARCPARRVRGQPGDRQRRQQFLVREKRRWCS